MQCNSQNFRLPSSWKLLPSCDLASFRFSGLRWGGWGWGWCDGLSPTRNEHLFLTPWRFGGWEVEPAKFLWLWWAIRLLWMVGV